MKGDRERRETEGDRGMARRKGDGPGGSEGLPVWARPPGSLRRQRFDRGCLRTACCCLLLSTAMLRHFLCIGISTDTRCIGMAASGLDRRPPDAVHRKRGDATAALSFFYFFFFFLSSLLAVLSRDRSTCMLTSGSASRYQIFPSGVFKTARQPSRWGSSTRPPAHREATSHLI